MGSLTVKTEQRLLPLMIVMYIKRSNRQALRGWIAATLISVPLFLHSSLPEIEEEVSFKLCAESQTWMRPSSELQLGIWKNPRYSNAIEYQRYFWTRNFFLGQGSASLEYDLNHLSGIWSAKDLVWFCHDSDRQKAISEKKKIEVWLLLYRVRSVTRKGAAYKFTIEPVGKGLEVVELERPPDTRTHALTITFLTSAGQQVEELREENLHMRKPDP